MTTTRSVLLREMTVVITVIETTVEGMMETKTEGERLTTKMTLVEPKMTTPEIGTMVGKKQATRTALNLIKMVAAEVVVVVEEKTKMIPTKTTRIETAEMMKMMVPTKTTPIEMKETTKMTEELMIPQTMPETIAVVTETKALAGVPTVRTETRRMAEEKEVAIERQATRTVEMAGATETTSINLG